MKNLILAAFLMLSIAVFATEPMIPQQRSAFIDFLVSTNVYSWIDNSDYIQFESDTLQHYCDLPGVECDGTGYIEMIIIPNNNLTGALPGGMDTLFPELLVLDIPDNNLSGGIFDALQNVSLLLLNLQNNNFQGCTNGILCNMAYYNLEGNPQLPYHGYYPSCDATETYANCNDNDSTTNTDIIQTNCTCKGQYQPNGLLSTGVDIDMKIESSGRGIILTDQDDGCWRVIVDTEGNLQTQSVNCN